MTLPPPPISVRSTISRHSHDSPHIRKEYNFSTHPCQPPYQEGVQFLDTSMTAPISGRSTISRHIHAGSISVRSTISRHSNDTPPPPHISKEYNFTTQPRQPSYQEGVQFLDTSMTAPISRSTISRHIHDGCPYQEGVQFHDTATTPFPSPPPDHIRKAYNFTIQPRPPPHIRKEFNFSTHACRPHISKEYNFTIQPRHPPSTPLQEGVQFLDTFMPAPYQQGVTQPRPPPPSPPPYQEGVQFLDTFMPTPYQ